MTVLFCYILVYRLYYQTGESEKKCIFSTNKLLNFAIADIFNPVSMESIGNCS